MNSRTWRRIAGAGAVAFLITAVAESEAPSSAHWKSKMEMEGGPQGNVTTDSEIWMKDKKVRMKTSVMGMNMNMVKAGDVLYQWSEGQKSGMKFDTTALGAQRNQGSSDYVMRIDEYRSKGKKIGAETVDGHACEIYELTASGPSEKEKKEAVWLAKDLNFPVKYVLETGGSKMTALNTDIQLNPKVDESMFAPPSDVQFQDMSEMMKGMRPPKQKE